MGDLKGEYDKITDAIEIAERELPDDPEHRDTWRAAQASARTLWQLAEDLALTAKLLDGVEGLPNEVRIMLEGMR